MNNALSNEKFCDNSIKSYQFQNILFFTIIIKNRIIFCMKKLRALRIKKKKKKKKKKTIPCILF